jgi:dolichyl-phosphate beta-glucosyltransferase
MKNIFLSIVIPAYKEAERIGTTLSRLKDYFKDKDYEYEIIVVNDGSPDDLVPVVEGYMPSMQQLRLIDNQKNAGKGYAVKCGMLQAKGQYRLFMDADNSVDISHLDAFIAQAHHGYEIVIGSIKVGLAKATEQNGLHRRILSTLSKMPVRLLATPGIHDTQRGFKLFTERAARTIFARQTINRFGFDIELLVIAQINGLSIKELPVVWNNPTGSTVGLFAYVDTLKELGVIVGKKIMGAYARERRRSPKAREAWDALMQSKQPALS